jgi:hypothetical protein
MQAPDYFSLEYLDAHIPSTSPIITLRSQLTPPRRVPSAASFSDWTHFTSHFTSTPLSSPLGSLKASVLCKGSGLSPSYDPPAAQWVYLGAQQPVFTGKPRDVRRRSSGLSSMSSSSSSGSIQEEILVFEKVEVKKGSGVSVLSQRIREKGVGGNKKWLEGLTCDELPSAFDDSDDED